MTVVTISALAILIGVILIGVLYVYMVYRKLLKKLDRQETKMNHILSLLGYLQNGSEAIDRNLHVVIKRIPSRIRIGGQDISVVNKERLDDNNLGNICVAEGFLQIADNFDNKKQCESSKINTFIHEVVHGVLDTMGESELSKNEKFVCTFSSLLVDTIEEIVKVNNEHTIGLLCNK